MSGGMGSGLGTLGSSAVGALGGVSKWASGGLGALAGVTKGMADQGAASAAQAQLNDQVALQREFAQQGIRWRVDDARAAGISPLAALGAPGASFSPVSIGSTPVESDLNLNMGQDIGRAIAAGITPEEKQLRQMQVASAELDLEGKALDNQIRARKLSEMNGTIGMPSPGDNFMPGQGSTALVKEKPLERTVSAPGRPAQEAGWRPDVAYARTDTGLTPVVPESLSESLEDDLIGKFMWRVRNQLIPNWNLSGRPPKSMLPKGATDWDWSYSKQEWQPVKERSENPSLREYLFGK